MKISVKVIDGPKHKVSPVSGIMFSDMQQWDIIRQRFDGIKVRRK